MAIVYKATNRINGKVYFGQTVRSLEQRKAAHASSARQGSPFRFHCAIRKYGIDCFEFEVMFEGKIDEVRIQEEFFIKESNATDRKIGYNAKPGGCGGWIVPNYKYDSWKQNVTAAVQSERNPRWSGHTDDQLVEIAKKIVVDLNLTYVPGFVTLRKLSGNLIPNICKGSYRFSGLGSKELVKRVSIELGLPVNSHYRSVEHRDKISKSLTGRRLSDDHRQKVIKTLKRKAVHAEN